MKKTLTRIGALTLALVLMLAICTTAFATEDLSSTGVVGNGGTNVTRVANSVSFVNVLTAYNPETTTVYAPRISYAFTIAAATAAADGVGTTITDNASLTAQVLPGDYDETINGVQYHVTGAPTIAVTYANTSASQGTSAQNASLTSAYYYMPDTNLLNASSDGTANTETVTVSFGTVDFPKAGVYRYKIERSVAGDAVTLNLMNFDDNAVRYLDVYVDGNGYIYGYTLHELTSNIDADDTPAKSTGYHDTYYTSNVTISKTLNGDTLMAGHKFPFSVTFSDTAANSGVVAASHIRVDNSPNTSNSTIDAMAKGAATNFAKISTGGSVTYYGIPAGVTVTAYESNNVTGTTYHTTVDATRTEGVTSASANGAVDSDDETGKNITWGTRDSYAEYDSTVAFNSGLATVHTGANDGTDAFNIAVVNTLQNISPTGIVMRVAPFVLILATGIVLLALIRRRREEIVEA